VGTFITEHTALPLGGAMPKEQPMRGPSIQRYEAMVAVRHNTYMPMIARTTGQTMEGGTFTLPPVARAVAAPYSRPLVGPAGQATWRAGLLRGWVLAHLGLAVLLAVAAAPLLALPALHPLGLSVTSVAVAVLLLAALAQGRAQAGHITQAALLLLLADILLAGLGLAILGPHLAALALLPGALLLAALLAGAFVAVAGTLATFTLYAATLVIGPQPLDAPTGIALLWVNLALVFAGLCLLGGALVIMSHRLRVAILEAAAATQRVAALERRAQTKRIAIDADAIALQTQLARALRGQATQPVTTCEDLAPLANMINAATKRLPGLQRDREERIRLETAIRDLITALETAWAGFTFTWPAKSGTSVDRLITMLRPPAAAHQASETTL
jgi:hypothetical protein